MKVNRGETRIMTAFILSMIENKNDQTSFSFLSIYFIKNEEEEEEKNLYT